MEQAKAEGNDFVIIKLGEAYNVDEYFEEHMTAALEAGLEVGVYYFSHAYTEATAVQEAEWVINTLNAYGYTDWHLQAGIWYDYEEHTQLRAYINAGALTSQDMTNCMSRFVNRLWQAGFNNVGIYSGYSLLWDETYAYSQMPSVPVWCAQYGATECDYPDAKIWQYSDNGLVAGLAVDVNYMY
nr:MAG TPA: hypothetical protein [Caudoviricetes sp.]